MSFSGDSGALSEQVGDAKVHHRLRYEVYEVRQGEQSFWMLGTSVSLEAYNRVVLWTESPFGYEMSCAVYQMVDGHKRSLRADPIESVSRVDGPYNACNWMGRHATEISGRGEYKVTWNGIVKVLESSGEKQVMIPLKTLNIVVS
ncbi:hypothetical protein ACGFYF_42120 [Streptomyces lavendulae]|uniref:hypothetical protein n=1 Tax=Streptomyces lavendulae TaxID=1914 RepID=UPI00371E46FB